MKKFLLICLIFVLFFQKSIQFTNLNSNQKALEKIQKEVLNSRKIHSNIKTATSSRKNLKKENKTKKLLRELLKRFDEKPSFFRMLIRYGKRAEINFK
jgi:hypothetical protein